MRLKVGDSIYCKNMHYGVPFVVIYVREKPNDDICIKWADGSNWWFGQIGESEPWTDMFISECEYLRNKNIDNILL